MLVLSRQRNESIIIGDDIEITVVDIRGDKIRLGINAPPHIPVHRKEVYEAMKREGRGKATEPGVGKSSSVVSLAGRNRHGDKPEKTPDNTDQPGKEGDSQ